MVMLSDLGAELVTPRDHSEDRTTRDLAPSQELPELRPSFSNTIDMFRIAETLSFAT